MGDQFSKDWEIPNNEDIRHTLNDSNNHRKKKKISEIDDSMVKFLRSDATMQLCYETPKIHLPQSIWLIM